MMPNAENNSSLAPLIWPRSILNVPGMLPAAIITYAGQINNVAPVADVLRVNKAH